MLPVGTLKLGTVQKYNKQLGILEVSLDFARESHNKKINVPFSLYSSNGLFIGTAPEPGTAVIVGQGEGEWYFVSFLQKNTAKLPSLNKDEILIQSTDFTKITLNKNSTINIGSSLSKIHLNTSRSILLDNFNNKLSFTEASRSINGIISRDKNPNQNVSSLSRLDSVEYDKFLSPIGLDPSYPTNSILRGPTKNPPFVELKEIIYEFSNSSAIGDEVSESELYKSSSSPNETYNLPNRRLNRTDSFSLSLVSPNYLLETIKGTAVDIFGNMLDLNRQPIIIDNKITLSENDSTNDKSLVFLKIRELQRKNLAYHFEINARKNLKSNKTIKLPDINSNADYSRPRSRFFLDIDKEGQFKLNVPASSETGNVPLLVRYENYSTYGIQDNNNVNKHYFKSDNKDIFLDSFANSYKSTIAVTENFGNISKTNSSSNNSKFTHKMSGVILYDESNIVSPKDRLLNEEPIKHNTPFHNILDTCFTSQTSQNNKYISYAYEPLFSTSKIPTIKSMVTDTITISGQNANAGGRSGSINFDGSIDLSIGANTIDRQSMWLDTAGGILANLGRDKNNISAAVSMDGDLILQVGGIGIVSDSRFQSPTFNNSFRSGAVDIRVFNAGFDCTIVRIDNNGIKIMTPGDMMFQSTGAMKFRGREIHMDAEHIVMHGTRPVLKHGDSI